MSSTVEFLTPDEIDRRREALVAEAGLGLNELRSRRERGLLDLEMQGLLDELEDLEFLRGED